MGYFANSRGIRGRKRVYLLNSHELLARRSEVVDGLLGITRKQRLENRDPNVATC
jgi:hypothetical protein